MEKRDIHMFRLSIEDEVPFSCLMFKEEAQEKYKEVKSKLESDFESSDIVEIEGWQDTADRAEITGTYRISKVVSASHWFHYAL